MSDFANSKMDSVDSSSTAKSRARLYRLLSELFRDGLNPSTRSELLELGEGVFELPADLEQDLAAAEHYEIFDLQLPPFESLYRDSSGLVGGEMERRMVERCQQLDCDLQSNGLPADHLANELLVTGELCRREYMAEGSSCETDLKNARLNLYHWLAEHPLQWTHAYGFALLELRHPFYSQLMELTLELLESHFEELSASHPLDSIPSLAMEQEAGKPFVSPRQFSEFLCLPVQCGMYLSKSQIAALASQLNLTTGFTTRPVMLQNVIESAIKFDQLDALFQTLEELTNRMILKYKDRIARRKDLQPFLACWTDRLEQTLDTIRSIELETEMTNGTS